MTTRGHTIRQAHGTAGAPRVPRPLVPQQSAIGLRRLNTSTRIPQDQQPIRSMLDIDVDNTTGNGPSRTQPPVRSMLDVDHPPQTTNNVTQPPPARPRRQHTLLRMPFRHRNRLDESTTLDNPDAMGLRTQGTQAPTQPSSMLDIDDKPQPGDRDRLGRFGRRRLHRQQRDGSADLPDRPQYEDYDQRIVSMLDVVDPEVATLSSITNVQNSLFVPSLGRWLNRRPTYDLTPMEAPYDTRSRRESRRESSPTGTFRSIDATSILSSGPPPEAHDFATNRNSVATIPEDKPLPNLPVRPEMGRIPSNITERFYAVRPHDTSLADWNDEDLAQLDDHVRHMLHSRRSAFGRSMKAFRQYVKRPLGFFVTLYATLITLFGLAWVLFLIGWIHVGDSERQDYLIDVIDQVLVALFAVVGDGMIPWRTVDTYHMIFIAHYHHLTWDTRKKLDAPKLKNKNDLPSETVQHPHDIQEDLPNLATPDLEAARELHLKEELSVLTPQQQAKLEHHQTKFANSHTFYKPHETETHHAFPLRLLVAIVVLLDFHSCFQLALGLSTWLIHYSVRPKALTATLLCCSITINITAGILISIGDRKTRKKDVVERMFRQELTKEAMRRVEEAKEKEKTEKDEAERKKKKESFLKRIDELEKLRSSLDEPRRSESGSARKSRDEVGKFSSSVSPRDRQSPETLPESPAGTPAEPEPFPRSP
ncbi:hypothetical protein Micbo1qcDRAFT_167441 [Microdochium bolleyi]|uniref:Integral membrane protein n=1 Tax=Microdochium bolleyi TaxID=196109 RepID=A0A136IR59_9PEZI|nr:hypothetical protein Micbo1qcDRAFT_167441 [Microdochium bolleyi]